MIKVALGLLAVGIAAMPFVDKDAEHEKVALAYSEDAVNAAADMNTKVYSVASQTGAECRIVSTDAPQNQQAVQSESACADVYVGLDRVTHWSPAENGDAVLKDRSGNTIMRVEPSDGFAFEAVTADGAQITFALNDV